jgi:hypothetical protein
MFSFIKWFGSLVERLKRNKGLWFTTLTTISLIGIFASLYFVNFLVSDVAKKTYENQKNHYVLELKNKFKEQENFIESVASVVAKDRSIANLIFNDDDNSSKKLNSEIKVLEQKLNEINGKGVFTLSLTHSKKAQKVVSVDVGKKGTVIRATVPMANKSGDIINVDLQESIIKLVQIYKKEDKDFAFFVTENSINKIDTDIKRKLYQTVDDRFFYHSKVFNENLIQDIKKPLVDTKLENDGYIKSAKYFSVYEKIYDKDGNLAGIAVVAEEIKNDNSFVNLVKNLVNSVTLVALGLIISMILFLF